MAHRKDAALALDRVDASLQHFRELTGVSAARGIRPGNAYVIILFYSSI